MSGFADAVRLIAGGMAGDTTGDTTGDVWDEVSGNIEEIRAGAEADHRRRLRAWEANAPWRDAAQAAYTRAMARRLAELGQDGGQPAVIAAGALWAPPGSFALF
jgi:hypothetical protein